MPRERMGTHLIQDEKGRPLRAQTMRARFDKARKIADVSFQFRDIRAKAATDLGDLGHAQALLGHSKRDRALCSPTHRRARQAAALIQRQQPMGEGSLPSSRPTPHEREHRRMPSDGLGRVIKTRNRRGQSSPLDR